MPMHEVVRSNLHTKLPRSLRLSSLAGTGLPERMRTTAFAFLGLTAALGLALVAIFAQLNFPLLSPAPLPGEGPSGGHVAAGVALGNGPDVPVAALAGGVPAPTAGAPAARRETERSASERAAAGLGGTAPVQVPSRDDAAAEAPEDPASPPPSAGTSPDAEPAAPASAQPEAEPVEPPPVKSGGLDPQPSRSAAKAEAKAAKTEAKAEKTEAKAAAKAEKTEAKAAKAEKAASSPPEVGRVPEPASPPPAPPGPETAPGKGKGKALGHDK
ncbi:MAG TPA: hypothetical protein VF125_00925 [Solirubrobacterales bacterium]